MFKIIFIMSPIFVLIIVSSANFFGYSKRQQHLWAKEHKNCRGKMQSPVAISTSKSIILSLPALEMNGFHNFLPRFLIVNNGHSVLLSLHSHDIQNKHQLPHIFGASLNGNHRYAFEGIHFHWGLKNSRGSEHVINGVRYPMEMHIIHRNIIYNDMKHAQEFADGLVVLAVLFQLQNEDNNDLNPILKHLHDVQWKDSEVKMNISVTLNSLLPKDMDTFYTYKGSLTTPPCNEAVTWIIFSNPVPISFRQMNKFRLLSNGEEILADNFRRLQKLGKRKIYLRKISNELVNYEDFRKFNSSNLEWFWQ